jgi:methionyl aminopeptidase
LIPPLIERPDYADDQKGRSKCEESEKSSSATIRVLNDEEQDALRETCRIGRIVLDEAARSLRVGMTTDEIDRIVHEVNSFSQ